MPNKLSQFWQELVRRKVIYFLIGYVTACFAIIEFLNNASDSFSIPEETIKVLYLIGAFGIPAVVIIPWFIYSKKNVDGGEDLILELKSTAQEKSIIVLPFENISPDPDQEYFSDGLTEEIITDLSHIRDLLVISRNSAMTFKGVRKTTREIAEKVNVRYILEGSVRKADSNFRITAQLIDANNDTHLWAEKYSGTLDDIFEIQEKVSNSIAESLRIEISKDVHHRIAEQSINDPLVYDLYLKARYETWQYNEISIDKAVDLLNQGLKLYGNNELLFSALCHANVQYVNNLLKNPSEYPELLSKANHYAAKAIQVNPKSASSYYAQGIAYFQSCHPREAIESFRKAIAIEPNHSEPYLYMHLGYLYSATGLEVIEAGKLMEKAKTMDPLTLIVKTCQGWRLFFQGEFQHAVEEFAEWQNSLEKINSPFMILNAWMHGLNQNLNEATRIIDQLVANKPEHISSSFGQFMKYSWLKEKDKALNAVNDQLEKAVWWDDLWSLIMAEGYAVIGEYDKAFHFLERATNYGIVNISFLTEYDPFLENIRGEERFVQLIEGIKKKWESLEI